MRSILHSISQTLAKLALILSALGLIAMTITVSWQVFGRYVLNDSPNWSEPITIQLMGWFILLGSAVGIRENYHLGFDVLRHVVPKPVARIMASISMLVVLVFAVAMAVYGMQLVVGTWTATLPVLGWPGGTDFMPLVAGGALMAFYAVEQLYLIVTGAADEVL